MTAIDRANRQPSLVLRTLVALIQSAAMVVLELALAVMVYVYLALYDIETFGWLVRASKGILDSAIGWMETLMPTLSNTAYATLLGELGPKAMLLLLVGLTVGAVLRFIAWLAKLLTPYPLAKDNWPDNTVPVPPSKSRLPV